MGLRLKILLGFCIIAAMLLIAGIWSIIEVRSVGSSVKEILDNNYKSISAAKKMKEALEREDSALLLILFGDSEEGENILHRADSTFTSAFTVARENITIEGEGDIVEKIFDRYKVFKRSWRSSISGDSSEKIKEWYFENLHHRFLDVSVNVDRLLNLNDKQMYETAVNVEDRSRRAIMPGIVAIIAAIVFTILFNYFINFYVVSPIIEITERIKKQISDGLQYQYSVETNDEISKLNEAVNMLCTYFAASESDK